MGELHPNIQKAEEQQSIETLENLTEKLINEALQLHRRFEEEKWNPEKKPQRKSFHNKEHVESTLKAIDIIFNQLENKDPFKIKEGLKKWNEENNTSFDINDLRKAFQIAFAYHDLGNIGEVKDKDNHQLFCFHEEYKSKDAEERSIQAVRFFIEKIAPNYPEKEKLLELIIHLIRQTIFAPEDLNQNFAVVVKFIDQVATNLLRKDSPDHLDGLNQELDGERKEKLDKKTLNNFTQKRFLELLGGYNKKELINQVLQIFSGEIRNKEFINELLQSNGFPPDSSNKSLRRN